MQVVRLNCSNCSYLETVSEYCDLDEVDKVYYHRLLEHFCEHTLSNHKYVVSFLEDHPKHILTCERVIFRLEWKETRELCLTSMRSLEILQRGVKVHLHCGYR